MNLRIFKFKLNSDTILSSFTFIIELFLINFKLEIILYEKTHTEERNLIIHHPAA
jgi:hypothetical protein